jgi:glycogen debranching enzyme
MCSVAVQTAFSLPQPARPLPDGHLEWLLTNAHGSFAMGCVDRVPRRKYHGLLTLREPAEGDPLHVLADVGETLTLNGNHYLLHAFEFGGPVWPQGFRHAVGFDPVDVRWTYDLGGVVLHRTLRLAHDADHAEIEYRLLGEGECTVWLTPYFTLRPFHALAHETPLLHGAAQGHGHAVEFQFYPRTPRVRVAVGGETARYEPSGQWVRGVRYPWENERGYPSDEDLYAPGAFKLECQAPATFTITVALDNVKAAARPRRERCAATLRGALEHAAGAYLAHRKNGFHTVIAGYPWFGEWGRDTLISLAGLCGAAGRADLQARVLNDYAGALHHGLVPNVLAARPHEVNPNSIDASLFFVRAVQQLSVHAPHQAAPLMPACMDILTAIKHGADKRVRVGEDGLVETAEGPWALTWMDAVIDGVPVTPRAGHAVDINALFYNAVRFTLAWAQERDERRFVDTFAPLVAGYPERFVRTFWDDERSHFADAVLHGVPDRALRPNQLWALGLPFSPVPEGIAAQALDRVTGGLLTPVGLRTLAPGEPGYAGRYAGSQAERDRAYHQGTVWPWLLGPYAEAAVRLWGAARAREVLAPTLERLAWHVEHEGCLGQVSEVFDGDAPHAAGGAPAQAWSVAELYRAVCMVEP